MPTYTIQEAEKQFPQILREVRSGQRVLIVDEEGDIAEIRPLHLAESESAEDYRRLVEEGILFPPEAWSSPEDLPPEDSSAPRANAPFHGAGRLCANSR